MATRLIAGFQFQLNTDTGGGNGITGDQVLPRATTLTDGRIAVVYESNQFGDLANADPIVTITANGLQQDVYLSTGEQTVPAIAPRIGFGMGIVFQNER